MNEQEMMEAWDPRRMAYEDPSFNSYVSGPARSIVGTRTYGKSKQTNRSLYVSGIPFELTERGLMNLFSRSGKVLSAKIMKPTPERNNNRDTYGFVKMQSLGDAERAIRDMNQFELEGFRFKVKMSFSDEERARRKEEKQEMSFLFNDEESDTEDKTLSKSSNYKENLPQSSMNGHGDGPGNQSKGIGRGQVLSELTGLCGKFWLSPDGGRVSRGDGGPSRKGLVGPGGSNSQMNTSLMSQPPHPQTTRGIHHMTRDNMENLTITVDRDNHRNLSQRNETMTLESLNSEGVHMRSSGHENRFANTQYGTQHGNAFADNQYGTRQGNRFADGPYNQQPANRFDNYQYNQQPANRFGNDQYGSQPPSRIPGNQYDPWQQYQPREQFVDQRPQYTETNRGQGHGISMGRGRDPYRPNMYASYPSNEFGYAGRGSLPGSYPHPPVQNLGVPPPLPSAGGLLQTVTPAPLTPKNLTGPAIQQQSVTVEKSKPKQKPKQQKDANLKECVNCGKLGSNACSKCKTPYCSRDCQKDDWPHHKNICQTVSRDLDVAQAFESRFDLSVGKELIPEVKKLMEKATGETIEVKMKDRKGDDRKQQSNHSNASDMTRRHDRGGYETDVGHDRRGRQNNRDAGGYETDTGKDKRGGRGCFNCSQTDHVKADCPKPFGFNTKCYNCQQMGHLSKDCTVKSGQNSESSTSYQTRPSKSKSTQQAQTKSMTAKTNDDWESDTEQTLKPVSKLSISPLAQSTPNREPDRKASVLETKKQIIPVAELPLNTEVPVVVTDPVSVNEIWLQDLNQALSLQSTMMAMEKKFSQSSCDVTQNQVVVGGFFGAKFTDGAWYRVCVQEVTRQGQVQVHYIDFGNTDTTTVSSLRQLDSDMMEQSAKAIMCTLDGIEPGVSVDKAVLQNFVMPDTLYKAVCKKVENRAGTKLFTVSMKNAKDADVVEQLLSEIKPVARNQAVPLATSPKQNLVMTTAIPNVTRRLTVGQQYAALIAFVTSPSQFTVQVLDLENLAEFGEFDGKLQEFYNTKAVDTYRPTKSGEVIISKYSEDKKWYRAEVVNIHSNEVDVIFIDFGNSERTSLQTCRKIKPEFMEFERKSVQCCLFDVKEPEGVWPSEILNLYQLFTTNIIMIEIKDVKNKVYSVELLSTDGQSYSSEIRKILGQSDETSVKSKTEAGPLVGSVVEMRFGELKLNQEVVVVLSDVLSLQFFHVTISSVENRQQLGSLMLELNKVCQSSKPYDPQVEEFVAAQFNDGEETLWYRGQVLEKTDSGYRILYVDYGNMSVVKRDGITKLDPEFFSVPTMAIPCSLKGLGKVASDETLLTAFKGFQNMEVKVKAVSVERDVYDVEMSLQTGMDVNSTLLAAVEETEMERPAHQSTSGNPETLTEQPNQNAQTSSSVIDNIPEVSSLPTQKLAMTYGELKLNAETNVTVTYVLTFGFFHVNISSSESRQQLGSLMLELNKVCQSSKPYDPQVEEFVAAQFHDGEETLWYRGQVLEKTDSGYRILYVDYGNMSVVKRDGITKLDPEFFSVPTMAIPCSLKGLGKVASDETLLTAFKNIQNMEVKVKAVSFNSEVYDVELFLQDGTNINSSLLSGVEDGDATSSNTTVDCNAVTPDLSRVERARLSEDGENAAITVHINNLASFFVQKTDQDSITALFELTKDLHQHCVGDTVPYSCRPGEFVAGLFDDGETKTWYRAEVLNVQSDNVEMFFIDYGNIDKVKLEDVRKLDSRFLGPPMMAVHCCLAGSAGTETAESVAEFKCILNHPVNLKIRGKQGDLYYVEMTLTNEERTCVNTLLKLDPSKNIGELSTQESNSNVKNVVPEQVSSIQTHGETHGEGNVIGSPTSTNTEGGSGKPQPRVPGSSLQIGSTVSGAAMSIDSVHSFYVMLEDLSVQKRLAELMAELQEDCKGKTANYTPVLGEYVAAFYSESGTDELWYRGEVTKIVDNGQFDIHYIDYGNSAVIETKHIKKLDDHFLKLPAFVTHCRLAGSEQLGEESSRQFKATHEGVAVNITALQRVNGIFEVQLVKDGKNVLCLIGGEIPPGSSRKSPIPVSVSTELVDQLPKPQTPSPRDRLPRKSASPLAAERTVVFSQTVTKNRPHGKEFEVFITSPLRPNLFHCQLKDETNLVTLKFLTDSMKLEYDQSSYDANIKFEVGEMCCAKFDDGEWYRATILDVFPDSTVSVEYVDYGNRSEVSLEHLRPVRTEYTELPLLAFRCTLHGVVPVDSTWNKAALEEFIRFSNKPLFAKLVSSNNDIYELDLWDGDGVNIAQHLIEVGVAKKEEEEQVLNEQERIKRENEILRRQLEQMQSQMAMLQMKK